ncbi:HNH endonuclease signature motif containing protein [Phytoactinopolyspora halophila]|nr:HNH endonuclease signature motif containing protein [Phytoactinopolyspora halophila]
MLNPPAPPPAEGEPPPGRYGEHHGAAAGDDATAAGHDATAARNGAESLSCILASASPGPGLAAVLNEVAVDQVSGHDTVSVMTAAYQQANHARAVFLQALLETGMRQPGSVETVSRVEVPHEFAAEEARVALAWSRRRADTTFELAFDVHHRLPVLGHAMLRGELDEARAQAFTQWTSGLADDDAAQICAELLPQAATLTVGQLIDRIKRRALAIDPDWAEKRYRNAMRQRRVVGSRNEDGTANLCGLDLPVNRTAAASDRVDTLARACKRSGDTRPIAHIRTDIFLGMLDGTLEQLTTDEIITHILTHPFTTDTHEADNTGGDEDTGGDGDPDDPNPDGTDGPTRPTGPGGTGGPSSPGGTGGPSSPDSTSGPSSPSGTSGVSVPHPDNPAARAPGARESGAHPDGGSPDVPVEPTNPGSTDTGSTNPGATNPGATNPGATDTGNKGVHPSHADMPPAEPATEATPATGANSWPVRELRVELSTLLEFNDHPAELPGWGYITAPLAREAVTTLFAAEWRWIICDERGQPVDHGITTRRPGPPGQGRPARQHSTRRGIVELHITHTDLDTLTTPNTHNSGWHAVVTDILEQHTASTSTTGRSTTGTSSTTDHDVRRRTATAGVRRLIEIRDRHCAHPSCRMPATRTDQDHTIDHAAGGPTIAANLVSLCRHDHRLKHHGGWHTHQPEYTLPRHAPSGHAPPEAGTLIWTSSLGHSYTSKPPPIIPELPRSRARPAAASYHAANPTHPAHVWRRASRRGRTLACGCHGSCACGPIMPARPTTSTRHGTRAPTQASAATSTISPMPEDDIPPF